MEQVRLGHQSRRELVELRLVAGQDIVPQVQVGAQGALLDLRGHIDGGASHGHADLVVAGGIGPGRGAHGVGLVPAHQHGRSRVQADLQLVVVVLEHLHADQGRELGGEGLALVAAIAVGARSGLLGDPGVQAGDLGGEGVHLGDDAGHVLVGLGPLVCDELVAALQAAHQALRLADDAGPHRTVLRPGRQLAEGGVELLDQGAQPGGPVVLEHRGDPLDPLVAGLGPALAGGGLGDLQVEVFIPHTHDVGQADARPELQGSEGLGRIGCQGGLLAGVVRRVDVGDVVADDAQRPWAAWSPESPMFKLEVSPGMGSS